MQFKGFPREGLAFLDELAINNNKGWFEANKPSYQAQLLGPAQAFITELGQRLQLIAPQIRYDTRTNGSGSLMRIYRDTRFSKDKTPYKTNISGMWWEGAGKKTVSPAFGFQLEADGMGLMTGMFAFPKPMLAAFREAIVDDVLGAKLIEIQNVVSKSAGYELVGEHYKRVPRGFDPDHPRAEWLKYNALYAHTEQRLSVEEIMSPSLVDICFDHFETMAPVHRWLVEVLSRVDG